MINGAADQNKRTLNFLNGTSEMARVINEANWTTTPLGHPNQWPGVLRTAVSLILDNPLAMCIAWGQQFIQIYNDSFKPILGSVKHPRALGSNFRDIFPEIWPIIGDCFTDAMKGKAVRFQDIMLPLNREGSNEACFFDLSCCPIKNDEGVVQGVLLIAIDTTEKKRTIEGNVDEQRRIQLALGESEQELKTVIHSAPFPIALHTGPEMRVQLANNAIIEAWEKGGDVLGKPFREIMPEFENQSIFNQLSEVFRTGKSMHIRNQRVEIVKDGQLKFGYYNYSFIALYNARREVYGILNVAADVTDLFLAKQKAEVSRNQIEEVVAMRTGELAEANYHLKRSNEALSQFAYIASHDLQEPIRKVAIYTQMLESSLGEMNSQSRGYLAKIKQSFERMQSLIKDVLIFSKLSEQEPDFKPVNLMEIVREVEKEFELLIEEKRAVLHLQPLPTVDAIPVQMIQLFSNLLSNALKYSKKDENPEIKILAETTAEFTTIKIIDNGIGFDQQYADRIFNIFQRLHGKRDYEGTGIGLAICKKIALNHGGDIHADSKTNAGTTFTVVLPLKH